MMAAAVLTSLGRKSPNQLSQAQWPVSSNAPVDPKLGLAVLGFPGGRGVDAGGFTTWGRS